MPQLKPIRSERAYERALSRTTELMGADPETPEGRELDILADLVELYERKHYSMGKLDPVDAIELRMEEHGLSPHDLIPYIGSPSRVSDVLARKRSLTLPMARALNKHLGIPAEVLLREPNPPEKWDHDHWRRFPLRAMANRGWIPSVPGLSHHAKEIMEKLLERAGTSPERAAMFRQTGLRANAKADSYALQAWCWQAMVHANRHRPKADYAPGTITLEVLRQIAQLSRLPDGPRRAADRLADFGIPLVTLTHLPRTYLDGAALQLIDGLPVVALTLRHDRLDNFWFCLLHELAHVGRHMDYDSPGAFLDDQSLRRAKPSAEEDPREAEADEWAEEALIPTEAWDVSSVRVRPTAMEVIHFADEIGVHPAIVAGRVRFERNNYRLLSQFVGSGVVRPQFEAFDEKGGTTMKKKQSRSVVQRPDGSWANLRHGAKRATSRHPTQAEAAQAARKGLGRSGGGELLIHSRNQQIRQKNTVPPATDPFPPKG